jgi:hypothetical protein
MSSNLTSFLLEHFNLGRDSTRYQRFNPSCLQLPFYTNPNGHLKPNPKYDAPTPYDFGEFKRVTTMSTGDVCRRLRIDNRNFNALISQTGFEKGNKLSSSLWCQLVEAAGLSERLILKPRYADIREEVLETSQILPTRHELFLIFGLSGRTIESISAESGLDEDKLVNNVHRGDNVIDEKLEYVNPNKDHNLTNIHSPVVTLDLAEWKVLRDFLGIKDSNFILMPPKLRSATLSAETEYRSPYKKVRDESDAGKQHDPLAEIKQFYIDEIGMEIPKEQRAIIDSGFDTPYFMLSTEEYQPPTPLELRSALFWTGYSIGELSMLLDTPVRELRFLSSFKAMNHESYNPKTGKTHAPKTKTIRFNTWRRFLEVFNLAHQKQITRAGTIE